MAMAVAKGQQRAGEVALGDEHVADLVVADREIALPGGIVGVPRGEGLADGQAVAKGLQRAGEVAPGRRARRRSCCG